MQFAPKSESDIARENLLEPGEYDFEVLTAEDKISKSGNEMIALKLAVFHEGRSKHVFDYLLEAFAHKLRHFCHGTGMGDLYDAGTVTAQDCVGRAGRVKLRISEDKTGQYQPKNEVVDYVVAESAAPAAPVTPAKPNSIAGVPRNITKSAPVPQHAGATNLGPGDADSIPF